MSGSATGPSPIRGQGPDGGDTAPYLRQCALAQRIRSRGNCLTQPDINELLRLGGQLNGYARTANTARRVVGRPGLGELLAEISEYARSLRAKVRS